jgi:deoxyribodipyrimidine photolyase-related protein
MNLHFILGDQLNLNISSLFDIDAKEDVIVMCEVWEEATYVKHHKKKIAFIFSAMRHFAKELKALGYNVHYTKLDAPDNAGSFRGEIERAVEIYQPEAIIITEPSEYRVLQDMKSWNFDASLDIRPDERFLCTQDEFADWADGRKQLRMEYFYREMRKKHGILMKDGKPEGGEWNYDSENRKPPKEGLNVPQTYMSGPDDITRDVLDLVAGRFKDHFGDLEPFHFAVTREQALQALGQFIKERISNFGDYQDAMVQGQPWMYHSHLSFYINCGLLLPMECVRAAEKAYYDGHAPLNAVEGLIRQIIGWREYVRGVYWLKMPEYEHENFLNAERNLPALFWGGDTQMNCLRQCVKETKENAYAHHIQRLMVLGNFALIAGLDPGEVNEWYMIVYADAYQWVELPNVTGMILFADGGVLGSKPYAASGSYINKMSDYCKGCRYKVTKKNGPDACPFNYLYWDFLIRNEDKLRGNHRLGMMYRTLERMGEEKVIAVKDDSRRFFKVLENDEKV